MLNGNVNEQEVVTETFVHPFVAMFIRIRPVAWQKAICLRIELYGCPGNVSYIITSSQKL